MARARHILSVIAAVTVVSLSTRAKQYLIVTSPDTNNVYYAELPSFHDLTLPINERPVVETKTLIDGEASKCTGDSCTSDSNLGLLRPQGLALHHGSEVDTLYVSDGETKNIYAYQVVQDSDGNLSAGEQKRVKTEVDGGADWLSVDGLGNLYYSQTEAKKIEMISFEQLQNTLAGNATATDVYGADDATNVAGPLGVAADAYNLYWANQDGGGDAGTIVKATSKTAGTPTPIVAEPAKAFGICIANGNAFFTSETRSLYAVRTDGGTVQEVSSKFETPRGCVYDKANTLYVADSAANAVYSLPATFKTLRPVRRLTKVMTVETPMQLAIFQGTADDLTWRAMLPSAASKSSCVLSSLAVVLGMYYSLT